jgi:hypothetical protein
MKITNSAKPKLPAIEAGTYSSYCLSMVNLGEQPSYDKDSQGNPLKWINTVCLDFEIPEEKDASGNPRRLSKNLTASAHEKATLVKYALDINQEAVVVGKSLDGSALIGRPVALILDINENDYNVIKGTSKIRAKDVSKMDEIHNPVFIFDAWDKEQDMECVKYLPRHIIIKILESHNADKICCEDELAERLTALEEQFAKDKEERDNKPKGAPAKKDVAPAKKAKPAPVVEADEECDESDMY